MKKIKKKFKFLKREVRFDQEGRVELVKLGVFPTFSRDESVDLAILPR